MIGEADRDHLVDMLRSAEEAIELLGRRDANALAVDRRTLLAVFYALLVIGEAANRVSADGRARIPAIRWGDVIGMRHHLAHGYDTIRTEVVVDTIRQDLPALAMVLRSALENDCT